ncbi:MAG: cell division ATP-binding protein FtsE [Erysipelotrichaceae bacterium]|nr:cell division ATP-binding protein FtsE [Erysipelotrichaceae bacterium]
MIEFKNVSKKYKNGTNALQNVNLKVEAGEFVYIMGPTGAGKSTLIKLLDGEEVPTGGSILVSGKNVGRIKKSKVYLYRRQIGVVFQDYRLLPEKTVFENVAYALEVLDWPNDKIRKRVREVLKLVDLSDKANVKPRELSGGQQQRVAIARAIAKRPSILIADEPTGNLDPSMTDEMISLLEKINTEEKTTLLVVTHNDVMVEYHPKRTIRIEYGHVVEDRKMNDPLARQEGINLKPSRPEEKPEETAVEIPANPPVEETEHVHDPEHVSETEKQDMMINEITEQLKVIEEIRREGGI